MTSTINRSPSFKSRTTPSIDSEKIESSAPSPTKKQKDQRSRSSLFKLVCLSLLSLSVYFLFFLNSQSSTLNSIMKNPFSHKHQDEDQAGPSSGKVNVAYFVNWGIYARKYFPKDVPVKDLTHLLYAFADVRPDSGEVFLTDKWADEDIHYDGDSWNDQSTNLYGNFKQFALLKQSNRNLKLLLSIGGWTFSSHFQPVASNPTLRSQFVTSSIKLLQDYGLDGLDIDWEYPKNDQEARDYVDLLKELRQGLNDFSRDKGCDAFLLTIAAPCGSDHYQKLELKEMDQYLDFWNLMAYDYAGSWDQKTGHQANLFGPAPSTQAAVDFYVSKGVPTSKLVMGMPLYGRSFENTDGLGKPYQGVGQGSWEAGSWDYKVLPLSGSKEHFDPKAGASHSYDENKRLLITYDNPESVKMKTDWIKEKGLRGAMFWEASGDHKDQDRSLIAKVARELGPLDSSLNHVDYPDSKFDNLRNHFS